MVLCNRHGLAITSIAGICLLLTGCSSGTKSELTDISDPYEGQNRAVFAFNMAVDDYALEPVARGYRAAAPDSVQQGVSNYLEWASLPKTAINSGLQGRLENASLATFRFAINALTFGTADLLEGEEKPFSEDMGQTLAYYDIPEGNYVVLPFIGSTTMRGAAGYIGDFVLNPLSAVQGTEASTVRTASIPVAAISYRAVYFDQFNDAKYNSLDPYSRLRSVYYQQRSAQLRDNGLASNDEDEFDSFFTE